MNDLPIVALPVVTGTTGFHGIMHVEIGCSKCRLKRGTYEGGHAESSRAPRTYNPPSVLCLSSGSGPGGVKLTVIGMTPLSLGEITALQRCVENLGPGAKSKQLHIAASHHCLFILLRST